MKSKITLKQIALNLGVSISTVSKALNNSEEISEPTKIKIQEFAKLNHYKPNITALNLKNRSTKTIAVIIPNILNSFFAKVFSGIEKVAEKKGYHVITCISNESIEKEIHPLQLLSNGTIDGFIVSISEESQKENLFNHFTEIINEGTPIVMFDRIADSVKCNKVIVDDYESAIYATEFLLKSGCKNVALFSSIDNLSIGKLRAKGYFEAINRNNITVNNSTVILTQNEADFDIEIAKVLQNKTIDGIFAIDEHSAVTAMKICLKNGLKIPEDLQIIGFADGLWSRRLTPSLSTISQHGPEIGKTAAKLLIEQLENKTEDYEYKTVVVKTELRYRDSTKKL